jgi:hypothetical protein
MKLGMEYQEYKVTFKGGLEKRLGLLGETHIYRPEETEFAREIVKNYDNFASEGSNRDNLSNLVLSLALVPTYFFAKPYFNKTARSFQNKTSGQIAYEQKKKINYFHDTDYVGFGKKLMIAALPVLTLITLPITVPFAAIYYAFNKDKTKPNPISKIFRKFSDYLVSMKERDKCMATKTIDYIQNSKDLLVRCGKAHLTGIYSNLQKDPRILSITKVGEAYPKYDTKIAPIPE